MRKGKNIGPDYTLPKIRIDFLLNRVRNIGGKKTSQQQEQQEQLMQRQQPTQP